MSLLKTQAFVIKKQDFRETSQIASFYTREYGLMSGLFKGIRADPRKFATTLEVFSLNELIVYPTRHSTLHLVTQCDCIENFTPLRADMSKTQCACLGMELLGAVVGIEDPNVELFNLASEMLKALLTSPQPEKIMTIFKIKCLTISGYEPHFDACVSCGAKIMAEARFSLSSGGLLCNRCFGKDTRARTIYRGTVATIVHIQRNTLTGNLTLGMNPAIKRELDMIINSFIQYHLERELKSQRVLNALSLTHSS